MQDIHVILIYWMNFQNTQEKIQGIIEAETSKEEIQGIIEETSGFWTNSLNCKEEKKTVKKVSIVLNLQHSYLDFAEVKRPTKSADAHAIESSLEKNI